MENKSVHSDPRIMGGTTVFIGTRVPVSIMFDYLRAGESLNFFLDQYPSVSKDAAFPTLEKAEKLVLSNARAAGSALFQQPDATEEKPWPPNINRLPHDLKR